MEAFWDSPLYSVIKRLRAVEPIDLLEYILLDCFRNHEPQQPKEHPQSLAAHQDGRSDESIEGCRAITGPTVNAEEPERAFSPLGQPGPVNKEKDPLCAVATEFDGYRKGDVEREDRLCIAMVPAERRV
ncbi:hypothetical protein BC938DRAFT_476270 [Jimgerdemannia flammicorona]|uniref:Uncharacterized protein n=1 Tax=Jimgerdemannia flammicorona TaxID=994334 RepID=A0A433QQP8_9FUNG|nr:hypothetical protein BC938DRAFT_476270 [Jimgerdemannia flammicorona]